MFYDFYSGGDITDAFRFTNNEPHNYKLIDRVYVKDTLGSLENWVDGDDKAVVIMLNDSTGRISRHIGEIPKWENK